MVLILDVEGHPERDRYYFSNDYPSEYIFQHPRLVFVTVCASVCVVGK